MSSDAVICVFAKAPIPGAVKTRLGARLGHQRAAAMARAFLRDTWAMTSRVARTRRILVTTEETAASSFGLPDSEVWLQGQGDLGERLERAFRRGLATAPAVIALGADSPGIPEHLLSEAVRALSMHDAVLGPATDGGFYLLGLRTCPTGLFRGLPWSEPTTFDAMRERLEDRALRIAVLESWFDVDRPEDLDRLRSMIARGEVEAPETARLVAELERL